MLKNNHALKLTVGEYKTPSGLLIHNKGISPHIVIKKPEQKRSKSSSLGEDWEITQAVKVLKEITL